ncbi:ABC transporter ATP-binding protein [Oceaniglobus trochenteri]|uniref:ABC transporter ATP-binding protein n=1 Tax=Oceaniglobus trochenteri TaxID=2763260 RepID=UPI001CFFE89A|nr:ABC transporter ATP-binding protein [Oceaniglobus trochenteri]
MATIEIRNLTKQFGAVQVLKGIDLAIDDRDFTVLLGPSGCGKSTLLNIIAGLEHQTAGQIMVDGTDISPLPPDKRRLAMVFQSYALYPTMTVRKNIDFGLRVAGLPRAEIKERVRVTAELLQITDLLDRTPARLSGGQRQRVAIGRALARRASVYLFDEPLSNLDAKLRNDMRIEIRQLHEDLGATAVYVTHDQVEAMTLATRIALMNAGRIEQYAEPQDIYDRPETLFAASFIGSPKMNLIPGTIRLADGVPVFDTGSDRISLAHYPFRLAPEDGMPATLGVRPEDVAPDAQGIVARHRLNEPHGADTLAWFTYGETNLSARLEPVAARALGAQATLGFNLHKLSLFDPKTERRL